jgi:predicted ATPase
LHQRIGAWEEQAYGACSGERATDLAMHFERGQDYRRALRYLQQAGAHAIQWCAHQEAIRLLSKALKLLTTWPEGPERDQQELAIQLALSTPLCTTKGLAALELEQTYSRAWTAGELPEAQCVALPSLYACNGVHSNSDPMRTRTAQDS